MWVPASTCTPISKVCSRAPSCNPRREWVLGPLFAAIKPSLGNPTQFPGSQLCKRIGVCARMDPQLDDQFERQFFSYVLDRIVPASAVQDPNQLQILSDADFEWWWILAARTSSLLKVLMKEAATGRDFIQTTASSVSGVAV